ncbi:MAG: hypothetical protein EOP56_07735 [Sphingobacteriales bacterium]|nr:MAG: hypothetical protein EOP56_07735 [Sphingobacteriales bacterium]
MPFFRVVFADNSIISCEEEKNVVPYNTDLYYEKDNDKLIFAYIRAENAAEANKIAKDLIERTKEGRK